MRLPGFLRQRTGLAGVGDRGKQQQELHVPQRLNDFTLFVHRLTAIPTVA
jgi:hypothetical protein